MLKFLMGSAWEESPHRGETWGDNILLARQAIENLRQISAHISEKILEPSFISRAFLKLCSARGRCSRLGLLSGLSFKRSRTSFLRCPCLGSAAQQHANWVHWQRVRRLRKSTFLGIFDVLRCACCLGIPAQDPL